MAEALSKEERERAWWDAWWAADYSWAGLAEKPVGWNVGTIHGGFRGEQTLQDYWRRDPDSGAIRDDETLRAAGELIDDPNGKAWHIVHVPLAWRDGTPAKAAWDAAQIAQQEVVIAARLGEAQETKTDQWCNAEAQDGRAQLSGAVLIHPPAMVEDRASPLHLVCDRARIPAWDAHEQTFGPGARFDSASFAGDARFVSASFAGYARFDSASFAGGASFDSASFAGDARFDSASFAGDASFDSASFAGYASFDSASFARYASFVSASFARYARFDSGQFKGIADFKTCTFVRSASFTSREFLGFVHFDEADFRGPMAFNTAVFEKAAFFQKIKWPRSARNRAAAFDLALFKGPAVFTDSGLQAFAAFGEAAFERRLRLDEASEKKATETFRRERHDAIEAAHRDVAAELKDGDDANQARRALAVLWRANQLFHRMLNRRSHPKPGAYWRKAAWALTRLMVAGWLAPETDPRLAREVGQRVREARTRRRRELERGCRIVKQAMEKSSNKTREQMCYRFEIAARRAQHDIPIWEWAFSWLYALASDYGASMIRPIIVALGVWMPGFAALYWGWARLLGPPVKDGAWQALAFSASRVFPFGFWTGGGAPASWLDRLLANGGAGADWLNAFLSHGQGWSFAIRLAATFESIGALTLLFLTGLALRRRFQIN